MIVEKITASINDRTRALTYFQPTTTSNLRPKIQQHEPKIPGFNDISFLDTRTPTPPSQARSGEFLKTCHRHVFLTEFHLIGSSPVTRPARFSSLQNKNDLGLLPGRVISGAGNGTRTRECELGKLVPYHLAIPAIE